MQDIFCVYNNTDVITSVVELITNKYMICVVVSLLCFLLLLLFGVFCLFLFCFV